MYDLAKALLNSTYGLQAGVGRDFVYCDTDSIKF